LLSVAAYLSCCLLVHRERYLPVFVSTCLEIVIHSLLSTFFIGWQYGFAFYMIALVPCSYYVVYTLHTRLPKMLLSTILALVSFLAFLGCRILAICIPPVYTFEDNVLEVFLFNFNTVCTYCFLIFFSAVFIFEMENFTRKLEEKNAQLEELASKDPLTRLFNRRCAYLHFPELTQKEEPFHVMMGDIDNFKSLNDTYGHDFGDVVLKDVAAIIQEKMQGRGYAFRWGGEEFLLLCLSQEPAHAFELADSIRRAVEAHSFDYDGTPVHCTLTLGVSMHSFGTNIDKTISAADKNLYTGKTGGKNVVIM
jgi:diguanylate cyclase (GGDEF)-like protein